MDNNNSRERVLRLGGEFEIFIDDFVRAPLETNSKYPIPSHPYQILLDTGRSAILVALQNIIRRGGETRAFVPRFCCPAVLAPFIQMGFTLQYYSMGSDLQTPAFLPQSLGRSTFLLIHYFGKKNQEILTWLSEHNVERNFFVIEDNVMSSLNSNTGTYGDYVIESYRKFFPVPDGAVVAAKTELACHTAEPDESFVSSKLIGKFLRGNQGPESVYLNYFSTSESLLEGTILPRKISTLSSYLMARIDKAAIARIRIENWHYLNEKLHTSKRLPDYLVPLFAKLEEGEVPLGFLVKISQGRDNLKQYLHDHKIYAPVHWPRIAQKNDPFWKEVADLQNTLLTLPIDQRVDFSMIDYLVKTLEAYFTLH